MASEGLACSICFERYDENKRSPRLLGCGHTFCTGCLSQLFKDGAIACPQDRKDIKVPTGVAGLPKNFSLLDVLLAKPQKLPKEAAPPRCETCDVEHPAVSTCLDCKENMCESATWFHTRHKSSRDHRVISLAEIKKNPKLAAVSVFCPVHTDERFRYFDTDCGHVICRDCFALNHNGHNCVSLADAASKCREALNALSSKASANVGKLKAAEERVGAASHDLDRKQEQELAKIHATFEEARAVLAAREQALVKELSRQHQVKAFTLNQQREYLRTLQACLSSAVERAAIAIKSPGDAQILVAKSDIASTLVAMESQSPTLAPQADAELEFTIDRKHLLDLLTEAGSISDTSTCATTTTAAGSGLEQARPGQEASFIITTRDRQGSLRGVGGDHFAVVLNLEEKGDVHVKPEDNGDGTFTASYVLPEDVEDGFQLSVMLRGTHIQGSPFHIQSTTTLTLSLNDGVGKPAVRAWCAQGSLRGYQFQLSVPVTVHAALFKVRPRPDSAAVVVRDGKQVASGSVLCAVVGADGWYQSSFDVPFELRSGDGVLLRGWNQVSYTKGDNALRTIAPGIYIESKVRASLSPNTYNIDMKLQYS